MTQSPELTEFYQFYRSWLQDGAKPSHSVLRSVGLCSALHHFGLSRHMSSERLEELHDEFVGQLQKAGLNKAFPFNSSYDTYLRETESHAAHLNPKRIAWVQERV